MNYNTIFSTAARSAEAHDAIQNWIRNEAPKHEAVIKRRALITTIALLEFIVACFDWVRGQIDKAPEYRLQYQLAVIKVKRYYIRLAIKVALFDERYQLTGTASKLWNRKSAITTKTMDRVFCLR